MSHKPVMLNEVAQILVWNDHGTYVDGTAGSGGHLQFLASSFPNCFFIGIDIDPEAVEFLQSKFADFPNVSIFRENYAHVRTVLEKCNKMSVDGVLLDLGISTHQALSSDRGFSIKNSGPLDMRFSSDQKVTAYQLVNLLSEEELANIIFKYGEEPHARKIARAIVSARKEKPIETTGELAEIVARSVGFRGRIHPATRVFQALRIATNDELENLQEALPKLLDVLSPMGRIGVITYHSLEDRIVKQCFRDWENSGIGKRVTKKVIKPSGEEVASNPSSRSAKLRVFERGVGVRGE
jgi:16S rRNA (cytosine1402-N4)-methyltransferase